MQDVPDSELKKVIGDFLEMGHVDNIIAMFRRNHAYYAWTGELLADERFSVRLGVSILMEELRKMQPKEIGRAIPSLLPLLTSDNPNLRGEAVSVLGIIGGPEAMAHVHAMATDPHPQVREVVALVLEEEQ